MDPVASSNEPEGKSLVLPAEAADALGRRYDFVAGMITLRVRSTLGAVGLTVAVTTALAEADIPWNVIAGFYHDHLFVPYRQSQEALAIRHGLSNHV